MESVCTDTEHIQAAKVAATKKFVLFLYTPLSLLLIMGSFLLSQLCAHYILIQYCIVLQTLNLLHPTHNPTSSHPLGCFHLLAELSWLSASSWPISLPETPLKGAAYLDGAGVALWGRRKADTQVLSFISGN